MTARRDIYNFPRRLDLIEAALERSDLPRKELRAVQEFRDTCIADGLSLARTAKYMQSIKVLYDRGLYAILAARQPKLVSLVAGLERSGLANWTKHDYKLALRRYLVYRGKDVLADQIRLSPVKTGKLPEELLTPSEICDLIEAARSLEDRAFLISLWESGARIGELLTLTRSRVQHDTMGAVILVEGKTGMRRLRLIESASLLDEWISCRSYKQDDLIFPGSYKAYTKRLKHLARKAGIEKRVYPHLFRHSRATYLAGFLTEYQLKTFMGWTPGSNMAAIYVHLAGQDLDAVLVAVPTLQAITQQHVATRAAPLKNTHFQALKKA